VNSLVCFIFISNTICFSFLVHCHLSLTLWRGKCSCALRDRATAVSSRDSVSLPCIERFNSIPVASFLHQHSRGPTGPLGPANNVGPRAEMPAQHCAVIFQFLIFIYYFKNSYKLQKYV
jgi:hypothetical protein